MHAAPPQPASTVPAKAAGLALPGADLFAKPHSLRWRSERAAFWLTLLCAPVTIAIIERFLPEQFSLQSLATLLVVAMVYVTIVRGRLLGTSIRAHHEQLPELHAVVERCARLLGMPMPHVFVREDLFVCVTSMGLGEPYSIAVSSQWLPHLKEDELTFLVGAELGHIAAGHTRISSLFSASGRENPFVALVVGAWLRRTEYTADRIGLLCCGSFDAAVRAIFKCSFHPVASRVSFSAFSDQRRELDVDPGLRMGEWLGETPYAVNRLRELQRFHDTDLYRYWMPEFERRARHIELAPTAPPEPPWTPKNAGVFQRGLAFCVDYIIVSIIASGATFVGRREFVAGNGAPPTDTEDQTVAAIDAWLRAHGIAFSATLDQASATMLFLLYSIILVAFAGRTFGMMVFGLRVVRNDLQRVNVGRAVWRYVLALLSAVLILPLCLGVFTGRFLHDRLSGTRLVRGVA